jgi:hypothetical protein
MARERVFNVVWIGANRASAPRPVRYGGGAVTVSAP